MLQPAAPTRAIFRNGGLPQVREALSFRRPLSHALQDDLARSPVPRAGPPGKRCESSAERCSEDACTRSAAV